jgi:acetolactate synthase I/II/III large subunit
MWAGEALVSTLEQLGARTFYTVPGESFLEVVDAVERNPRTRLISTRHESGAAFMAEAEAKLRHRPAVAMATRAVGASNLAIGVYTAFHDSTPLIALVGQVGSGRAGREAFQETDLLSFYRPITKWVGQLSSGDRAVELATKAYTIATTGRPGPVLLALPGDVLRQPVEPPGPGLAHRLLAGAPEPPDHAVAATAKLLAAGSRPVLIAGGGARQAREELIACAQAYGIGVYSAFRRQDVFPNDHPLYLGHLTLGTSEGVLRSLREADVILVVGCRLSEVTTQSYTLPTEEAQIVQVDIDPAALASVTSPDLGIVADSKAMLSALLHRRTGPPSPRSWVAEHATYLDESTAPAPPPDGAPTHPAEVAAALQQVFPPETVITNDAGNFSTFVHHYYRFTQPLTQIGPTSGAMGYGVPAAIGAHIACPDRPVVAVTGDGGVLMTGQELETAARYGFPIVVVVLRNGMYGSIAMHQMREFGRTSGTDISSVDLAGYARSLGALGWTVRDRRELVPALREAAASGRPALVDVPVDPDHMTPSVRLSQLGRHSAGA